MSHPEHWAVHHEYCRCDECGKEFLEWLNAELDKRTPPTDPYHQFEQSRKAEK